MGKVAVLGLGESLKEFVNEGYDNVIGVNDIWRYVKTDVVVCLDYPKAFTPDRLDVINNCKPIAFYSQMVIWNTRPDFVKIDLLPGYPDQIYVINYPGLPKSYCSPFVACGIAYRYYNATEIHLFGVDLVNHPHLDKTICNKIKTHFRNLKLTLESKGCHLIVHGNGILTIQL
jgi:hypothetical protein